MAARLVGNPDQQFFKNDGSVNAGGTLTFYTAGTTTPKTIYRTTNTGGATHSNPQTLDSAGRPTAPIFTDGLYDILIKDSGGSTLVSVSNYGDNNSAVATDLSNLVLNASFETDANSDNVADNWTETEHANISIARSTTAPGHGTAHQRFTVSGAGTASCLSSLFEVSNLTRLKGSMLLDTSSASLQVKVYLLIYNKAQSLLATETIYSSTANPTSYTEKKFSDIFIGDHEATGRYAALKLEVADNSATGTVDFDGIELYKVVASKNAPVIPEGLVISTDTDTAHDLNITSGSCKDSTGTYDLVLQSEITKKIDATWAAGDNAGGAEGSFSIPSEALFYIWLIGSSTTGAVDVLFSNSATSPSMPSGFDKKRRIFSWPCDSSNNLLPGYHDGLDKFYLTTILSDVVDNTLSTGTAVTATFLCPPNGEYYGTAYINPADAWDLASLKLEHTASTSAFVYEGIDSAGHQDIDEWFFPISQNVNASSQYKYTLVWTNASSMVLTFYARGYRDTARNIL